MAKWTSRSLGQLASALTHSIISPHTQRHSGSQRELEMLLVLQLRDPIPLPLPIEIWGRKKQEIQWQASDKRQRQWHNRQSPKQNHLVPSGRRANLNAHFDALSNSSTSLSERVQDKLIDWSLGARVIDLARLKLAGLLPWMSVSISDSGGGSSINISRMCRRQCWCRLLRGSFQDL